MKFSTYKVEMRNKIKIDRKGSVLKGDENIVIVEERVRVRGREGDDMYEHIGRNLGSFDMYIMCIRELLWEVLFSVS